MPIKLDPDAFYDADSVRNLLEVTSHTIGKACRSGDLRCSEQCGRKMFRGKWLIDWIEGRGDQRREGEVQHARA